MVFQLDVEIDGYEFSETQKDAVYQFIIDVIADSSFDLEELLELPMDVTLSILSQKS